MALYFLEEAMESGWDHHFEVPFFISIIIIRKWHIYTCSYIDIFIWHKGFWWVGSGGKWKIGSLTFVKKLEGDY